MPEYFFCVGARAKKAVWYEAREATIYTAAVRMYQ